MCCTNDIFLFLKRCIFEESFIKKLRVDRYISVRYVKKGTTCESSKNDKHNKDMSGCKHDISKEMLKSSIWGLIISQSLQALKKSAFEF